MKQAYIIHGWGGTTTESWFPWLKKELKSRGFKVEVPAMPNPNTPKIRDWVDNLNILKDKLSALTINVGDKEHINGEAGIFKLPEILKIIGEIDNED